MAQTASLMTPDQVKKIEANYAEIVNNVHADDIMDYFVDEGFFSIGDVVEKIMKEKTDKSKTEQLVMLLCGKKSKAGIFDFFLKQLEEHGKEDLARRIKETEKKPIPVSEGREGEDRYQEIPEKLKNEKVTEKYAMYLSATFSADKVTEFGVCLDLSEVDISHVQADKKNFRESDRVQELIIKWKNRNGHSATLGNLLNVFQENSDDIELSEEAYKKALEKIIKSYQN